MSKQEELEQLTELFRQLGEPNDRAESLARSQVEEDKPVLARELFLRLTKDSCIWSNDLDNVSLVDKSKRLDLREKATNRLLQAGAEKQDILDVVRHAQFETLKALFYLMEDSTMIQDILPDDVDAKELGISWGFCQLSEEDELISPIWSLHESISSDEL